MGQLEAEVLTRLLLGSFVIMYQRRRKLSARADIVTTLTLWSVCDYWRQIVKRQQSQLKSLVFRGEFLSLCKVG